MIKKIILIIILCIPLTINASSTTEARIGNNYYETLEEAIENASSKDIISLISNVVLDNGLTINKEIHINLNGNDITAPTNVFLVSGGSLYLTGTGTIKETNPNYGAIKVIGSPTYTDGKYSIVDVGENITLEGWSGIFISHTSNKSYGVNINMKGKINAVSDTSGSKGIGIYVNGSIKDEISSPNINILNGAEIISNGYGLYIGGYSTFNIGETYIKGTLAGIGIKAGILNIDGATVICDGKDYTPTEGNTNGINASGTAIQIESNTGYKGDMEINIKNGNFTSKNSHVIYEYIGKGTKSLVKTISIKNGTFISEASKDVFSFSDSFKEFHKNFISGGNYSSNPNPYLIGGYTSTLEDGLYTISKTTMKEILLSNKTETPSSNFTLIVITIFFIIIALIIYLNKSIIYKLIKKLF